MATANRVQQRRVGRVPLRTLPPVGLQEDRAECLLSRVERRGAQRPGVLHRLERVQDVVDLDEVLAVLGLDVRRGQLVRLEPVDVARVQVEPRTCPSTSHSAIARATPAGVGHPDRLGDPEPVAPRRTRPSSGMLSVVNENTPLKPSVDRRTSRRAGQQRGRSSQRGREVVRGERQHRRLTSASATRDDVVGGHTASARAGSSRCRAGRRSPGSRGRRPGGAGSAGSPRLSRRAAAAPVSVQANWWASGVSARVCRPSRRRVGPQMPAQQTTMSAGSSPRSVTTPVTRSPSARMSSTSVRSRTDARARRPGAAGPRPPGPPWRCRPGDEEPTEHDRRVQQVEAGHASRSGSSSSAPRPQAVAKPWRRCSSARPLGAGGDLQAAHRQVARLALESSSPTAAHRVPGESLITLVRLVWNTTPGAWEVDPPAAGSGPWSTHRDLGPARGRSARRPATRRRCRRR